MPATGAAPAGAPGGGMAGSYDSLRTGATACSALRILRQWCSKGCLPGLRSRSSLAQVTRPMTDLAQFARTCLLHPRDWTPARHAARAQGHAPSCGCGHGSWARGTEFSSDIDLIYVYDHGGETAGVAAGPHSPRYSASWSRPSTAWSETPPSTASCPVDLARGPAPRPLRFRSGPRDYLQVQGREWSALPGSRAGRGASQRDRERLVRSLPRSATACAVFCRSCSALLDYSVFDSLRVLHKQIRGMLPAACLAARAGNV